MFFRVHIYFTSQMTDFSLMPCAFIEENFIMDADYQPPSVAETQPQRSLSKKEKKVNPNPPYTL